jgi:3-oxoadipate enol-lactonase
MTLELHHVSEGDGPCVVLLGSLGSTVAMWEPQLAALQGFRVIRIDLPGHGGSPVPDRAFTIKDIADAVCELVDAPATYVGISLGGVVAMCIAANADVDKLVLACTKPAFPPSAQWRERAATVRREGMAAVADAVLGRWFTNGAPPEYREMLLSCSPEGYARCCEALADADLSTDLARIVAPTLVIAGAHDPSVTPDEARTLPGWLVVLDDAAHLANADAPAGFNDALLAHLVA